MDINNYFSNFKTPDFVKVTDRDVEIEFEKYNREFPEMEPLTETEKDIWKKEIAIERFVNSIITKIHQETGINYNEI